MMRPLHAAGRLLALPYSGLRGESVMVSPNYAGIILLAISSVCLLATRKSRTADPADVF